MLVRDVTDVTVLKRILIPCYYQESINIEDLGEHLIREQRK